MENAAPSPITGMKVRRFFTTPGMDPADEVAWDLRTALISGEDGKSVFEQKDVEVPKSWSMMATNIAASKYFRGTPGTPERESSVRKLVARVVDTLTRWGAEGGYFALKEDEQAFRAELTHLLLRQKAAFNSPVWFNVGVEEHPQCSACFINSVDDNMEALLNLAKTEGMLFKYGSGTGSNLSTIRSKKELLAGGGTASGPVSFMKGFDAFAGVIKSGGKTRRAAKMVILNADHPDILDFIRSKAHEEKKAWALIDAGYDGSFNGEAYSSIFYQNANHSVRVTDDFMQLVESEMLLAQKTEGYDKDPVQNWFLKAVKTGEVMERVSARKLFREIAEAAHLCGDPGLQFDTNINDWHTCPNSGRINASNPCQPAWATVLTPQGISTIGTLKVGDLIWSGKQWTRVTAKWSTGIKQVFRYETRAGSFIGTTNHRVVSHGEKIEVANADSIDTAQGGYEPMSDIRMVWDDQDVVDGLVFGDGRVVLANDGRQQYPVLHVGTNDQDYFRYPGVASRVNAIPYDRTAHRVETTLSKLELPKTYEREVPDRFFYGTPEKVMAFLRGLYSANGSVVDGRVTLKATSFKVIDQVQQMLSMLGIRSYVTVNPPKEVEFENGTYECKQSYDLNVTTDRAVFLSRIGFLQIYKLEKLVEAVKMNPSPRGPKTSYEIINMEALGEHEVFDLTVEAEEHTYWTGGLLVSNCSEYMHLDDSACNLASFNLMHFRTIDGEFDVTAFKHAVDVLLLAMEIIVGFSKYPTEKIRKNALKFRQLGLGYANLGAFLMSMGLPYDSDTGRDYAAAITSLMCGRAYRMSALLAKHRGPFEGFPENREPMLRVLRMHHSVAQRLLLARQNGHIPENMLQAQLENWEDAVELGERHGVLHSQVTVLAPTGTIGFLMDCDTSGIEPGIALVSYKKLVGGGMLKIVNQTVPLALEKLGYTMGQIQDIIIYLDREETIEGAPHLKPEHLAVFDCAFRPKKGQRSIHWRGHLKMMGAVQPFLSGAISKTVNMPADATVEDIEQAYLESWKLGIKAVALYRDGCKRTQPLNTSKDELRKEEMRPQSIRHKLPDERQAITHKFCVGGHEGYMTVGMYEDGTPGELFCVMAKEGSVVSGLMDSFATAVSLALQYGVPLQVLVDKFSHTRFEPSGFTGNPKIPIAKSIIDYIFRWMGEKFLSDTAIEVKVEEKRTEVVEVRPPETAPHRAFVGQSDAPPCTVCGELMIRNGACYKCENCGTTNGCS